MIYLVAGLVTGLALIIAVEVGLPYLVEDTFKQKMIKGIIGLIVLLVCIHELLTT